MNNFAVPTSLEGLSMGTILLALLGNGLMVPRALFTRDSIWLLGSAWGSAFSWLQLLSMFVGRSASGCAPDAQGKDGCSRRTRGACFMTSLQVSQEQWRMSCYEAMQPLAVLVLLTSRACHSSAPSARATRRIMLILHVFGPRRQPYVGDLLFYSITAAFVTCVLVVLSADARSKGVSFPLGSITSLFTSPREAAETS